MKAVFFDLDYTLYDNYQYYVGAFYEIASYLASKYNLIQNDLYQSLVKLWKEKTSMYSCLFDDFLDSLNLADEGVKTIVEIFNNYEVNEQHLYSDSIPILNKLKQKGHKIGIITDGTISRQQRKIINLNLDRFVDAIIYTKKIEPKPSQLPFISALNKIQIKPENAFYVADNPHLDFKGSKEAGLTTIRILRGEFKEVPNYGNIDHLITNLEEILHIIELKPN